MKNANTLWQNSRIIDVRADGLYNDLCA